MSYKYIWKIELDSKYTEEEFIKFWRESSMILQQYPGAEGTKIHRVEGQDRTYLAIAQWESKAARNSMQSDSAAGESDLSKQWLKFPRNESFGKTMFIARAEEIEAVHPEK